MADRQGERFWLIHFEDVDRDVEVFTDEEAARRRSEDVGQAWTHTLFVEAAALDRLAVRLSEAGALLELITQVIDGEMGFQSVDEVRQFLAAGLRAGRV